MRATALERYQRLEAAGLWRDHAEAQRRDVIVSFGEASLVLTDLRDQPLAHWSLAAVVRLNPGETPALYAPDTDETGECLEVDEPEMIEAITRVGEAIARARPRPGRLRLVLLSTMLAALVAALVFWMPGVLRRHTVSVVPDSARAEIGAELLTRIARGGGMPCDGAQGQRALARLSQRLLSDGQALAVLPGGIAVSAHLPGGTILLNRAVIEDYDDADVTAGFILAEAARATAADPLDDLLRAAGWQAAFRLLTTGRLDEVTLETEAHRLMTTPPAALPDEALLARFAAAGVPSSPYAYALDVTGETVLGLIEADPMRGAPRTPVLSDGDWVRLQGICGN